MRKYQNLYDWCLENNQNLLQEWDYDKNDDLQPELIASRAKRKVWWKCRTCGYEWQTTVYHRVYGTGCPACRGHIATAARNLKTECPSLCEEWYSEKNMGMTPERFLPGSNKKIWWKCKTCGYEWQATISDRALSNTGCPSCTNRIATDKNNLKVSFPAIAEEWNYEKNENLIPEQIVPGSSKKVWWKCKTCGHEWQSVISSRSSGCGCPACSGRVATKETNLFVANPKLCEEWDYEKNHGLIPEQFRPGSNKKVWWKCKTCGHEWQSVINSRSSGCGCPECTKMYSTSFSEQAIFFYTRYFFPDSINRDKTAIGKELDVYIPSIHTAIEYDGYPWHSSPRIIENDYEKDELCKQIGINLFRIQDKMITTDHPACVVFKRKSESIQDLQSVLVRLFSMLGIKNTEEIDLLRDQTTILSSYLSSKKADSLVFTHRELVEEWDYDKNDEILPEQITYGSDLSVWWKCKDCGYSWKARVTNRSILGRGCPACSGRVVTENNNFKIMYPDICEEWDYEKNGALLPSAIRGTSNKKVWWKCKTCGYEWQAAVYRRVKGSECPSCTNSRQTASSYYNLLVTNPDLCEEWDNDKNVSIHPAQVTRGSDQHVWWKCKKCGYSWKARIANRAILNRGCPSCTGQVVTKLSSLITINPDLCEEWDYEKNNGLTPESFLPGSNKKVWWRCKTCGYEWQASINNRTTGTGCPVCKGNIVTEKNSLKTVYPQIAEEWATDLNDTSPEHVRPNSNKKFRWICQKCGHIWTASPATRIAGHGCPACSGRVATKDRNLEILYPKLCEEWDYSKNGSMSPHGILPGSGKKVWWKCKTCGHEWVAAVYTRTSGSGCPKCYRERTRKKTDC